MCCRSAQDGTGRPDEGGAPAGQLDPPTEGQRRTGRVVLLDLLLVEAVHLDALLPKLLPKVVSHQLALYPPQHPGPDRAEPRSSE